MTYTEFLSRKKRNAAFIGFDVDEESMNKNAFPFQKFIVKKALKAGRYAIFANCGLGKTLMQLMFAHHIYEYTGKPVLILAPLAVSGQTIQEGVKFGIEVSKYRSGNIQISNYEQLENIDASLFSGIVLDESSILKNYDGAYKTRLIENFSNTKYRLCCTATPSPNDEVELTNHAEFLGIMKASEVWSKYFVHNASGTGDKYRIKRHAKSEYWRFVSTWATMVSMPSDIGFNDEGYKLPPLNFIEQKIITEHRGTSLFNDTAVSATNFNAELRLTILPRIESAINIINASEESFICWVKHNEESSVLAKKINGAIEVAGSNTNDEKEKRLLGFAKDEFRVLVTKAKIGMYGLNFQNCHNMLFTAPDFSFEALYQTIRREYRFGQKHAVNVYLVTTDTMQNVIEALKRKEDQFNEMQQQMNRYVNNI